MQIKLFEVRDRGTFIPVMAIKMVPSTVPSKAERERYLLRRAGYNWGETFADIVLVRCDCGGATRQAACDPYDWNDGTRTMRAAHLYLCRAFDHLNSGEVVDVEFINGETKSPKASEAITHANI